MALATELGYQGIDCLVTERRDGTVSHPKMNMISTRTMEFCRRWGVADEIRGAGWPTDHPMNIAYVTSLSGYRISGFDYPSYDDRAPWQHTPEGHQRCSQLFFDPVIQKRAESFNSVSARYRTLFRSFEQDDEGDWILTAAVVAAPTYWWPDEQIGRSLFGLHHPVPGGDPDLARRINRVFDNLQPGKVLERFNWTVQAEGTRHTPERPGAEGITPEQLFPMLLHA